MIISYEHCYCVYCIKALVLSISRCPQNSGPYRTPGKLDTSSPIKLGSSQIGSTVSSIIIFIALFLNTLDFSCVGETVISPKQMTER